MKKTPQTKGAGGDGQGTDFPTGISDFVTSL